MAPQTGRPLRVLFVDTVPRLSGAEQSLADLAEQLHEVGVEPVVCLPGEGPLSQRLRAHGVLVRTIEVNPELLTVSRGALARRPWLVILRMFSLLAAGRRLRKLIRDVQPMVVHSNTLKAHLLCVLPCLMTRTPLVWHLRDILPRNWLSAALIWCARFASVVIVPSRAVAEPLQLSKKVFRKVRLVPNGIRAAAFADAAADRSLRQVIGARRNDPVIGLVGRIAPWKGQEVFLRAAAMLAQRHPTARFALAGAVLFENDAPFDAYLRRLVLDLRIEDRVAFLGHQPAPEAMAACDIVVHCSLEPEPFGRVIAEAMAAGKPVVAAAGGATAEILPPAAGFIVPPGRPELLADALDRLISDPELCEHMGEAGADVAASFFDLERVVHSVAQIHRALAARTIRRRRGRRRASAVAKVAATLPKPRRVKATRRKESVSLPKHGWHRDARGIWVPPEGQADVWAASSAEWAPSAPPAAFDDVDEDYEAEAFDDADVEDDADELEDDADDFDDEYEAETDEDFEDEDFDEAYEAEDDFDDEDDFEDDDVEDGGDDFDLPPVAVAFPSAPPAPAPASPAPMPASPSPAKAEPGAPSGVAILDLASAERAARPAPRRPSPASVAGGQAGVVARVTASPRSTHTAPAYPVSYPLPPRAPAANPPASPHLGYALLKRTMDLVVSLLVLILGSPVWLGIAIAIKLGSSGPVLHRGIVHGVGGRAFTYYKFRTMRVGLSDAEHRRFIERYVLENGGHVDGGETVYKLTSDTRVTPIGALLRRLSLDEIPQLLNVLKGQMSLVGPRPPLDYEFELYDERAMARLAVRPGITGLQQVWARNMASFEDKLRMDLNYIRQRTIWMDVKLLLHTIPAAFRGH